MGLYIAFIRSRPQLRGLDRLLGISGGLRVVVDGDEESLRIGGAIAQFVRSPDAFLGELTLSDIAIHPGQKRMRHGELSIEGEGAPEQRHDVRRSHCGSDVPGSGVSLQGIQRRRGGLRQRRVVLAEGSQRLAGMRAEGGRDPAEPVQYILFFCDLHLLAVKKISGATSLRAKSQHVLLAYWSDGSFEHGRARRWVASSGVGVASAGCFISCRVFAIRSSEIKLK